MKKKKLIQPAQVEQAAKQKEKENLRFRTFLKKHADADVLDQQFLQLHHQIFPLYDCSLCRNCCKLLHAQIPEWEIDRDAAHLKMPREQFIQNYLEQTGFGEWSSKQLPCGFLDENGACRLGECRPESCKKFPYTDQPERLSSLYSILTAASVCPATYEIIEELKRLYDYHSYRQGKRRAVSLLESDGDVSFIAGYTSWGFPYGVKRDYEEESASPEELPF